MAEGEVSGYREVDIESWNRRSAFEFFREFEDPFFNMTAPVDVTRLRSLCRESGYSFSIAALYCSQKALNGIEEFRMRLVDGRLLIFDLVEATQTLLLEDESFGFCYFPWREELPDFDSVGKRQVVKYKELATFDVENDRLDLVYYSVIPWISFTSFKHASRFDREQTVPRIVFGKAFEEGGSVKMPVSVEANHMIMDGLHVGRYFERLQAALDHAS
ncbi:MAG: chloramphenicol acetyltransferase [Acidobacteriota bacterium]|nr:MAG: chloramphenicol acetyltransferase [Acidobacteriota bacterium]